MNTTWAAQLYGPRDLRWQQRELAKLGPDRVRVRLAAGGICGSDLHYFRHGRSGDFVLRAPLVLGHEVAGVIAEVGSAVEGLVPGDPVAVNPARWCGRCQYCLAGRANLCRDIFFLGSASRTPHMQGGFAEYFDVASAQCIKVSSEVDLADLALAEPLAVALHAVRRGSNPDAPAASACVVGGGPIGQLLLMALKHAGHADVTLVEVAERPLALAAELGALTIDAASDREAVAAHPGFELVFEASGNPVGMADAIRLAKPGGVLVQVGNLPAGDVPAPLNLIMSKELEVRGTFRFDREFAQAVELIENGAIAVSKLVTLTRPLAEAAAAFESALDRAHNIKVLLTSPDTASDTPNSGPERRRR